MLTWPVPQVFQVLHMAGNGPQVVGRFNAHNLLLVAVLFGFQVNWLRG